MSVKCGIGQVGLVAVLAFEVSASVVVFGPSLSTLLGGVMLIAVTALIGFSAIVASVVLVVLISFHSASLLIEIQVKLYYI